MVFGISAANLWIFREKFLLALSKLQSPLLRNRFWWKKNFVQKIANSICSKFGRVFPIFANEVTTGLSRLRCFCSNDRFNKEVFRIAYKFFLISGIPAKSFQVLTRNPDRMVTTTFYMRRSTIWGKKISFQKIHIFSVLLLESEWQICGFLEKKFW